MVSKTKHDTKRAQLSSNDPTVISVIETVEPIKPVKSKNKLKGGANNEINHEYSDETLHKIYLKMDFEMQIYSNDKQ